MTSYLKQHSCRKNFPRYKLAAKVVPSRPYTVRLWPQGWGLNHSTHGTDQAGLLLRGSGSVFYIIARKQDCPLTKRMLSDQNGLLRNAVFHIPTAQ